MKRHLLFLVNPIAGTRTKHSLSEYIAKTCTGAGISHSFVESTREMDAETLRHFIADHHATDLVACGGDGTVNLAASAVQNTPINLGIIAVGSGNGLARGACIPLKPSLALKLILNGQTMLIDAFTINNHFSCMLSGVGFDAAVAERFAKSNRRGLMSYTTQTLIEFFKANPYQFEIKLPEFSFFTDAFFVSVANSNQFGNNVTIAPKASLTDGLLDLVIVQKMPKSGMPLAILKQIRGNNHLHNLAESIGKQHVLYLQTPSVEISNIKLAPMHVDGDPCETAKTIYAKVVPQSVRLFAP